MRMEAVRVALVDEVTLSRETLAGQLRQVGLHVNPVTGDGEEFLSELEAAAPDVALIALFIRNHGGLSLLREARRRCPRTGFIVLSLVAEPEVRRAALASGASCFID